MGISRGQKKGAQLYLETGRTCNDTTVNGLLGITAPELVKEETLADIFAATVHRFPQQVAVKENSASWSYHQLRATLQRRLPPYMVPAWFEPVDSFPTDQQQSRSKPASSPRLGNDVYLNADATVQTHLFEDRVMKQSYVTIDDCCDVGETSLVLYDTHLHPGSSLGDLSLLMRNESLPAGTCWAGIPARRANDGSARIADTNR